MMRNINIMTALLAAFLMLSAGSALAQDAEKPAQEWEDYLQANHVPAGRVRPLDQALADPQLETRKILHRHEAVPGVGKPVTVPMCAFKFEHGGPSIEMPPPQFGEHNEEILESLGYTKADIAALKQDGII